MRILAKSWAAHGIVRLSLLLAASCSAPTPSPSPFAPTASTLRDKAVFALSRGHDADARRFAEDALAVSGQDAQAHLVLAVLEFRACRPDLADAHLAVVADRIPEDFPFADAVAQVREGLKRFGRIALKAPSGPDASRPRVVRIEPTSPALDPEKRACLDVLARRIQEPLSLPATLWVPAGEYRVQDGEPVVIGPGACEWMEIR